ncbi:hypothetical protein [Dyadobacter frigoris]|uniref:Uncharacterized protein n=1 Tax=Dyadobacter frigoris TaxID=2576211 RepID=A0A4U6DDL6_9BACT|nr:hypothetical protein [Dyadobacter frigoris]TKT92534.1 hypothetical protein FDK13_11280 [Dyadobacter frigoris]GLU55328.1 hypothetical protein Dfri01_47890 [Dyadobacter frigoris]
MKDGKSVFVVLALTVFIVYVMRNFLGRLSSFFFVPIDNLLFISHSIPPVLMWMILGLLIGLVYGSFISIKKFKLDYKLLVYPGLILLISLSLILLASFVVKKVIDRPNTGSVESKDTDGHFLTSANRAKLNEILKKGILAVENERYETAEELFIKASTLGKGDPRLDSLSRIYTNIGNDKCALFRSDTELKYIPNYYYKYAAALTNKAPKICK